MGGEGGSWEATEEVMATRPRWEQWGWQEEVRLGTILEVTPEHNQITKQTAPGCCSNCSKEGTQWPHLDRMVRKSFLVKS